MEAQVQFHLKQTASGIVTTETKRVIFLLLPEVNLLDLAGPVQVFQTASYYGAGYQLEYCANQEVLSSSQGLVFAQLKPLTTVSAGDLVVIPGLNLEGKTLNDKGLDVELRQWLQEAYHSGAYLASICSGAFALGDAGLLDNRQCTTHWDVVRSLQARYPKARVLDNVLYVHDGSISTSAGIASGIDMALSLVERDYGALLTSQVARYLVVYLRRAASQTQISVYLQYRTHLHPNIHRVQDYLIEHTTDYIALRQLAEVAQMSIRSLNRIFKENTGITPIQYQQRLRLEIASNLIQSSDLTIDDIATKCGFEDTRHFRRLWQRQFGAPPSALRASLVHREKMKGQTL